MGMLTERAERLDAVIRRLEDEVNRSLLRGVVGQQAAHPFRTVFILPPIPTASAGAEIVFLQSFDLLIWLTVFPLKTVFVPRDNPLDTYWWAGPASTVWTPIGGKLGDLDGSPGNLSGV